MIWQRNDAGAALLSILLIVATLSLAALIATEAIVRQTELHKLASRKSMAIWAARSAEVIAISTAAEIVEASRLPAGNNDEARQVELALPVEGGRIVLTLRELPPCFNLNALGNPDPLVQKRSIDGLRILLEDIGVTHGDAVRAADVLADWIDADNHIRPSGAEDSAYLALPKPYRPANQLLSSLDELAAIPEFTPTLRAALAPFACALPSTEPAEINVNALAPMTALVLRAAAAGALSSIEARRFIEARPRNGWNDVQAMRSSLAGKTQIEAALADVPLTVRGGFFMGEGSIALDAARWRFRFMMRAGTAHGPDIVWRAFGEAG